MAPPWEMPKRRRWFRGLTGNALATTVISAVVSGVISFAVAHYQSQDTARQAVTIQQVQQVIQLESDVKTFFTAAINAYSTFVNCMAVNNDAETCLNNNKQWNSVSTTETPVKIDLYSISDQPLRNEVSEFDQSASSHLTNALSYRGGNWANELAKWDTVSKEYVAIVVRCGQIIQGQN